jgi:hypothetical protein
VTQKTNNLDTSKAVQVIDQSAGEALIPEEYETIPTDSIIAYSSDLSEKFFQVKGASRQPLHMVMLEQMPFSPELKEMLLNAYDGTETRMMKDWINRNNGKLITVLGMRVFEHGPYKAKNGGEEMPGFFQLQILIDQKDEDGAYIVLRSSSAGLAPHAFNAIQARGWWLFWDRKANRPDPQVYRFFVGSGGGHFMRNQHVNLADYLADFVVEGA